MSHAADTEQRLTDLEIKVGFMEDLVDSLNEVVARQQQHMVGHLVGMALVVGHQQHRPLPGKAFEQLQQQVAVVILQIGGGLVAHQQGGLSGCLAQDGNGTLMEG